MVEASSRASHVGQLIKSWRAARRISQLNLALEANISSRHLCFVETGRAQPSREMVLTIAQALDVPLRERNALLLAAGYAPLYGETDLDAPEMAHIKHVISLILERYEPFGAVAIDRHWNVLLANRAFGRMFDTLGIERPTERLNLLELFFTDTGIRRHIVNWDEVAYEIIQRVHREALDERGNSQVSELLRRILDTEGTPPKWRFLDIQKNAPLMIPFHMRVGELDLRLFSTITTLGTPQDITLQELRIEATLPADAETERLICEMAAGEHSAWRRDRGWAVGPAAASTKDGWGGRGRPPEPPHEAAGLSPKNPMTTRRRP